MGCQLPAKFTFGGQPISLPAAETLQKEVTPDGTRSNDTWTSPNRRLQVMRSCTTLDGGGAWQVLRFAHVGNSTESPLAPLSAALSYSGFLQGSYQLFYSIGSSGQPTDFAPRRVDLKPGSNLSLAPFGGRSSDQALPMFHLINRTAANQTSTPNLWIGIGWTGTWRLDLLPTATGLHIAVGMNATNIQLLPGESIRTPSVVTLPYYGIEAFGLNRWRRFVIR